MTWRLPPEPRPPPKRVSYGDAVAREPNTGPSLAPLVLLLAVLAGLALGLLLTT